MIENEDLEELDSALRRTRAVDAKLLHLRNRLLTPTANIDAAGSHPGAPVESAAADAEEEKPAPRATASAYRLLAASISAGATRDRLLQKAAELEKDARASARPV